MKLFNRESVEEKQVREQQEREMKEQVNNEIEQYRMNSKKIFEVGSCESIILTNDNKIVFVYDENVQHRESTKRIDKIIDIDDILKVDMTCKTNTKYVHQWYNVLVYTMECKEQIQYLELKIITLDEIYRFKIDNVYARKTRERYFDNLEILMTYLERKIKNNEF